MAIEALAALIPPPASPIDAVGDWSAAENDMDCTFPCDFKDLIRVYGTGRMFGIRIANPLQRWGRDTICDDIARFRELREACEFSLPLFPEQPGFLPWGSDSNGHLYCWWTAGASDSWTVAQVAHGEEETPHDAPRTITSFLAAYVQNQYPAMLGGREFNVADRRFEQGIPWLAQRQAEPGTAADGGA